MVSLIELIKRREYPLHQYMDIETVNWIKENKPLFNISTPQNFNLKLKKDDFILELKKYIPDPNWFLVFKKKDSIHGMRHILRVIFHSIYLVWLNGNKSPRFFKNCLVMIEPSEL